MVYLEKGTPAAGRPTVLLLHGFAAMKENWALWLQRLPDHWHILVPDLLSRSDALRHIFDDMLADALAPARYLGPDTPPLQVQWGDRDVITPTRCVDWFRTATPNADIRLFRNVGHLPMLEIPGLSARALAGFVERHSGHH